MDAPPNEALVIVDPSAGGAPDEVRRHAAVSQEMSGRLLVVDAGSSDLARLRQLPGVRVVSAPAPPDALDGLSEGEALFVSAWSSRQGGKGPRAGEGLAWDAPGHEPP